MSSWELVRENSILEPIASQTPLPYQSRASANDQSHIEKRFKDFSESPVQTVVHGHHRCSGFIVCTEKLSRGGLCSFDRRAATVNDSTAAQTAVTEAVASAAPTMPTPWQGPMIELQNVTRLFGTHARGRRCLVPRPIR